MKTLKQVKSGVTPQQVLNSISRQYSCCMGGSRTLLVNGEALLFIDDRKCYAGRGARYNKSINHDIQFYNLTKAEYDDIVNKIARAKYEVLVDERLQAKSWRSDIEDFIFAAKENWHLGSTRVWHNVIPSGPNVSRYLQNQLRNWLLADGRVEKLGFIFYENDYNYSPERFLSKEDSLNRDNKEIFAIFSSNFEV